MYQLRCAIRGIAPVLHHKFGSDVLESLMVSTKKVSSQEKYAFEWMKTMYATADGYLCQPAAHVEASMVKAATEFKVPGKGATRKSFKDYFKSWVYVEPDELIHFYQGQPVLAPDESLMVEPTDHLKVNITRMIVNRSAVARARLEIGVGWELNFTVRVIDELIEPSFVQAVLTEAGRSKGIGDSRPRYGRFEIVGFESV